MTEKSAYKGNFPGEYAATRESADAARRDELRDELAMHAMGSLIIAGLNTDAWRDYDDMAESAYRIADAMLMARRK